jgi:glycerate kinase
VRVVVAPDKFTGSLTAPQVAASLTAGLVRAAPGTEVVQVPVADGGDGTLDAAVSAGYRWVPVSAQGPTGEPVQTAYAERSGTAVVEMADVSGLRRLPGGRPAARTASSHGTGEVIRAALDVGCRRIVLGIGGSASTDGGAGLVQALGGRLLDAGGRDVGRGGAALAAVESLDLAGLHPALRDAELVVASDVVGFAALAVLGAQLRPGIDLVLDLVDFRAALPGAGLVVTGEGSLDEHTLHGKAPAGVAAAARAAGVTVVAVAGRSLLDPADLAPTGIRAVYALTDIEPDPARCTSEAGPLLERLAARLAADWVTDDDEERMA